MKTTYPTFLKSVIVLLALFGYGTAHAQYCSTPAFDCTDNDRLITLNFATISHSPTCNATTGYNNYTTSVSPGQALLGNTYTMSAKVGYADDEVGVWIDYNHNNTFESSEYTYIGLAASNNQTLTGSVTIPVTALTGTTRMRVAVYYFWGILASDPCFTQSYTGDYGEVDDYTINITSPATSCLSAPVAPANNATGTCSGNTILRWNKAQWATSYDVYLNSGTGTPTTIVSTSQTDTFFVASTGVGPYVWKVVPKNSAGSASGCNTFSFTTVPGISPSVTIDVSPNDTACPNSPVTFTATPVNGGTAPSYQWKKNNTNVGTNSNIYIAPSLVNNDVVQVVMTSNSTGCLTSTTATSNIDTIRILPVPAVTITADGPTAFCTGGAVTLSTTAAGTSYTWLSNGTPAGGTTNSFVAMYNGYYKVLVTSGPANCPSMSDSVLVTVYSLPFPHVNRTGNVLSTESTYASYQWYKDNVAISGATSDTYTVTNDGWYTVRVTDMQSCNGTSAYVPVNDLAVGNISAADISIYPNPATSQVTIKAPVKVTAAIRSVDGKLVLRQQDAGQIDISRLANGIYYLSVTDKEGRVIRVEKLVKAAH